VKIRVDFTRLNEARFALRAAELAARRQAGSVVATTQVEVTDGQRELGAAAGDVRPPDER